MLGPPSTSDSPPAPRTPLLRLLWEELRIGLPLCLGVALFLSVAFGDPFLPNLAYSLCIGLSIQGLIEGGRYALAHGQRRLGRQGVLLYNDWPGWALMLPWILISVVVGYLFGSMLGDMVTGGHHLQRLFKADNRRSLALISVVVLAVSLGTCYFFYSRGRLAAIEALAESNRRAAAETQLRLLQSQLEPHMLFNTLANLRVLIGLDPPQAQAMLDHLIAFLRSTLAGTRVDRHALMTEFETLNDYLALMKVRMGDRLQSRFEMPEEVADLSLPPLLLQPLVENAIKHGLEPKVAGGRLEIGAQRLHDRLQLRVRDTGIGLAAAAANGHGTQFGLQQVRERLARLYGERASLTVRPAPDAEGGTEALIVLPLEQPA